MRTCLGAAAELRCVEQLPAGWPDGAALVHVEGYILYKPALARDALRAARRAGALVSLVAPCSAECFKVTTGIMLPRAL
jgi:sugar/nucleoside kinase (ribokinase family)